MSHMVFPQWSLAFNLTESIGKSQTSKMSLETVNMFIAVDLVTKINKLREFCRQWGEELLLSIRGGEFSLSLGGKWSTVKRLLDQ